ncbi:MAG TPA: helix-turn-helix domain-containing protein [Solirubrobacteraceae bacterium]|nr:helix-turn-helix domain-containing protein [Solirubrobacteraceae bacterium]
MGYREQAPPVALEPWLDCTWERRAEDAAPQRVLPDGCIDIVWIEAGGTRLVGPSTSAFLVPLPPGTRVAGARLHPGAAASLLGVAPEAIRDAALPIEAVWGDEGARLAAALDEHADPAAALRGALLVRAAAAERPDPLVAEVVTRLRRPDAAVGRLARELAISERQLRRRVSVAVGYGPKLLLRVLRLGRALAAARDGDELARVAYDAGYADQSHFSNDCRTLAGASPSVVIAPSRPISPSVPSPHRPS